MAKKNFDAFINSAGKKPKPTPEEVEAMAKQLHTVGTPPAVSSAAVAPAPIPAVSLPSAPVKQTVIKVEKAAAQPIAKQKSTPANSPTSRPPSTVSRQPSTVNRSPSTVSRQPSTASRQVEAPKEKVRITIDLAKDLYKRMKLAVVENETEISAYIRQLIENDLNRKKG
jgi:hypothetical protein